jgi:hypothetical protein
MGEMHFLQLKKFAQKTSKAKMVSFKNSLSKSGSKRPHFTSIETGGYTQKGAKRM